MEAANPLLSRRALCLGLGAGLACGVAAPALAIMPASAMHMLETRTGGRLGVSIYDVERGGNIMGGWRESEPFAFASSFKFSLAALVLMGAETGEWRLDEVIHYGRGDLLDNAPVTAAHLAQGGMTMAALAKAAQTTSDNTAANLLLARVGGPARLTSFWHSLGALHSRIDDVEPALNRVPPGSLRNTTTPRDMVRVMDRLLASDGVLSDASRDMLKGWMHETQTGKDRLRAGLPADWWVGDKTGTAYPKDLPGTYVDLAWIEAPGKGPVAVAAFYQPARPTPDGDPGAEAVLAEVGRLVAQSLY